MKVLIAAGGTGGHIYPGIAVAKEIMRRDAGREVRFVGTARGLETKIVPAGGGSGRSVTAEPGHYVEPTFSPSGQLVAYRKSSDGYLTTPLWGRDPGIYVVSTRGGAPKKVVKEGTMPQFGAANDRIFFMANESEDKRSLRSID